MPILTVDEARRKERQRRQMTNARLPVRPPPPAILDRASRATQGENKLSSDNQQTDIEMQGVSDSCNNAERAQNSESAERQDPPHTQENPQDYGKSWHNWSSSSKMPSGKYGKAPYQPLNSSQGSGKSDCMRGGKREVSETPSRGGYREKGVSPMTASKKPEHLGWSSPKNPEGKPNLPAKQENLQQSMSNANQKGTVSTSPNEKPNGNHSDGQKGEPSFSVSQSPSTDQSKGEAGKSTFNLASVVPEPTEIPQGSSSEAWRGTRRPRNSPSSASGNASSNWRSWHDWKKSDPN